LQDNILEFLDKGSRDFQQALSLVRLGKAGEALPVLERLCAKGDGHAYAARAAIYDFGFGGVPQNKSLAVSYYTEACRICGARLAGRGLAKLLYLGHGVQMDRPQAFMIYEEIAARSTDKMANLAVGLMLARGEGVERDTTRAITFLMTAAEDGYIEAHEQLIELFRERRSWLWWINAKLELVACKVSIALGRKKLRVSDWSGRFTG
jgi:TPR repeat protein